MPTRYVKNTDDRLVVLNKVVLSVVEGRRGKHEALAFAHRGKPVAQMLNSA